MPPVMDGTLTVVLGQVWIMIRHISPRSNSHELGAERANDTKGRYGIVATATK